MIPEHTCYVEPFFGAGWVYFGKSPSKAEVINDIDGELINLFRVIRTHPEELARHTENEFSARERFEEFRESTKGMTDIQRAVRYLYLISHSFGGKGRNYGYGTTKGPKQSILPAEMAATLSDRLKNTYVENRSFEEIFRRYDREHTFFFCDPPYFETCIEFSPDQNITFGQAEHEKLAGILRQIKGKFMLTINDHPFIREIYEGFWIEEVEVGYSIAKVGEGRRGYAELIIQKHTK